MGKKTPKPPSGALPPASAQAVAAAVGGIPLPATATDLVQATSLLDSISTEALEALLLSRTKLAAGPSTARTSFLDKKLTPKDTLNSVKTDVLSNDAPMCSTLHEQLEQILAGTFTLLEATTDAIEVKDEKSELASECAKMISRRLQCLSTALKKAGPGANGSFAAAYDLWHARRQQFMQEEFKPDVIDKADVEDAVGKHKQRYREKAPYDFSSDRSRPAPRRDSRGGYRPGDTNRQAQRPQEKDRSRSRSPAKRK